MLTWRKAEQGFEMRRSDETLVGDRVCLNNIDETFGSVIEKESCDLSPDQMIIVWTPSMYLLVDNISSTCHTDDVSPRAAQLLNYICQTRLGRFIYDRLEGHINNPESRLRKAVSAMVLTKGERMHAQI